MSDKRSPHVTDHLANERTFLAWLRTSVAMMGFGIVIVRLREMSPQTAVVNGHLHAVHLGLLFALIGLAMMPFALWHYLRARRAIDNEDFRPSIWGVVVFSVALVALGFVVVLYLFSAVSNGAPSVSTTF